MFVAIFPSDCPFSSFFQTSAAKQKSFIRVISSVRYAAQNYNIQNALYCGDWDKGTHPKHIWNRCNWIADETLEPEKIAAKMVYETEDNSQLWTVIIKELE